MDAAAAELSAPTTRPHAALCWTRKGASAILRHPPPHMLLCLLALCALRCLVWLR